jgi:hypothetical protein
LLRHGEESQQQKEEEEQQNGSDASGEKSKTETYTKDYIKRQYRLMYVSVLSLALYDFFVVQVTESF